MGCAARWVAAWWLVRCENFRRVDVAVILGVKPSGVSQMINKLHERLDTDLEVSGWVTALIGFERSREKRSA